MTRWARINKTHSAKGEDPTPWNIMKKVNNLENESSESKSNNDSSVTKKAKKDIKVNKPVQTNNSDVVNELEARNPVGKKLVEKRKIIKGVNKNKNGYIDLDPEVEKSIQKLKGTLWNKGFSGEEIRGVIRKERRHAEIVKKREMKKVCFNCRKPGHNLSDCPEISSSADQSTGICFKCGSTEHSIMQCHIKTSNFPFAKCFICGEQGHLSRKCPDNPRGLYPNGGCCKNCGSVEHFKKDCPKLQDKATELFVEKISSNASVDAERFNVVKKDTSDAVKMKKVVKF
ncbi:Zinc finger CCHC domain-containing protein 9 [Nymphon striatum]|nr:Zinc finger CCHC domain-containing protein 9 [Nymphon striatum]